MFAVSPIGRDDPHHSTDGHHLDNHPVEHHSLTVNGEHGHDDSVVTPEPDTAPDETNVEDKKLAKEEEKSAGVVSVLPVLPCCFIVFVHTPLDSILRVELR